MKVIGYCTNGSKQFVAFADRDCGGDSFKITDGFHDRVIDAGSQKANNIEWVEKTDINLERIVKRIRGVRPWHPLLRILRKEIAE